MLGRHDRMERVALLATVVLAVAGLLGLGLGSSFLLGVAGIGLGCLVVVTLLETHRKVRLEHEATRFQIGEGVREATAAMQLVALVDAPAPLPAMGDWAMQPSALVTLLHLVRRHRPDLVVELGSGSSTVVLGHAVKAYGGRIVSIEHDDRFADATREMLAAHGLADTCVVRVAPLADVALADGTRRWYSTDVFEDLDGIGLLVVDGPPEVTGPQARRPALPLLRHRLAPGAFVVLDDAGRPDEQRIVAAWEAQFPELEPVRSVAPRVAVRRVGP